MGTQFFWFYDILIIAIFLGVTFRCLRKGFVSSMVSLAAAGVAFAAGIFLSGITAPAVYDSFVKSRIEDYINQSIDNLADQNTLMQLSKIDASKIVINGTPLSEIDKTPDPAGKITLDLKKVDLSGTGIDSLNLDFLGIRQENLSEIDAGKANITSAELAQSDIGTLVLSKVLANTIQNSGQYEVIENAAKSVNGVLPQISGALSGGINNAVSEVIITVMKSEGGGITAALLDNLITPVIMVPLRTLIFFIIFVIICLTLSFLAKALSVVNRIPLVGPVNSLLGGVVGVLKSAVIIFLICIGVKILITITGNTIIFLNTMTIEQSVVFKHIYYLDFINF